MNRRDFISLLVATGAAAPLAQCACPRPSPPATQGQTLIDAHCHVFNASDLPAEAFIRVTFLHDYPHHTGPQALMAGRDRDFLDGLIDLFLWILGNDDAPSAQAEIEFLSGRAPAIAHAKDLDAAAAQTIARTSSYLQRVNQHVGPLSTVSPDQQRKSAAIRKALIEAAGQPERARDLAPLSAPETNSTAQRAYFSISEIGTYLRWFRLFIAYRHVLVDQLVADHKQQGFTTELLAPAIIDYSKWLGQPTKSPLTDQARVMGAIAKRKEGPPVHGYIAFDPLREVYHRRKGEGDSALAIVEEALTQHGFIGVKLYPPMGFKPSGNVGPSKQTYPQFIADDIGDSIGDDLDIALNDLYSLCTRLHAPILAHAADTNSALEHTGEFADPTFWLPVAAQYPDLRICLGHFGPMTYRAAGQPPTAPMPDASWEWVTGGYLKQHLDAGLYADVSYFSELLTASQDGRKAFAANFLRYKDLDQSMKHLIFGTDWVLLGRESKYTSYTTVVYQFLRDDCKFAPDIIEAIFFRNARTFLGLNPGDPTRARLEAFYQANGIQMRI